MKQVTISASNYKQIGSFCSCSKCNAERNKFHNDMLIIMSQLCIVQFFVLQLL